MRLEGKVAAITGGASGFITYELHETDPDA